MMMFGLMMMKLFYKNMTPELDTYSFPDFLVHMMSPYEYGLIVVPVLLFAVIHCLKDDFLNSRVLFYSSKRELWIDQEKKIFYLSVFFIILLLALTVGFGYAEHQIWFNWDQTQSYYYLKTHQLFYGNPLQVWIAAFFIGFVRNFIFCNLILLSKWAWNRTMPGIILGILICVCEIIFDSSITEMLIGLKKIEILMSLFSLDYPMFQDRGERFVMVIALGVILVLIALVMKQVLKKKEFIHDKVF